MRRLSTRVHAPPTRSALLLLALAFLAGCGDDAPAGAPDAATLDHGQPGEQGVALDVGAPPDLSQPPQDQAGTAGALSDLLSAAAWTELFPNGNSLYTRAALLAAAAYYPDFASTGTAEQRRQELAAFLANIAHETTGGWPTAPGGPQAWGLYFVEEVGCESGGCTGYCDASNQTYPCAPGRTYHGRGPIQLSWNYNYGQVGAVLGLDLLSQPSLVTSDGVVAFRTALWFWMTAQAPKPSAHDVMTGGWTPSAADLAAGRRPGFGMTVNIINGGLECQQPTNAKVEDRVAFYQRFTGMLGSSTGADLYCDQMQHY